MTDRCPHCGVKLPGTGDAFCPECRQTLDAPSSAALRALADSPEFMRDAAESFLDEIDGMEALTNEQIFWELRHGAKFVEYQICVSFVFVTIYRATRVHFIRSHESAIVRGMKYTLLSLAAGWWGFPFGPFCTIAAVMINLSGGRNVTPANGMMNALRNS